MSNEFKNLLHLETVFILVSVSCEEWFFLFITELHVLLSVIHINAFALCFYAITIKDSSVNHL